MDNLRAIFGIQFGISKEEVFDKLKGRYYHYSDFQNPSPNSVVIDWIEIAGRKADKVIVYQFKVIIFAAYVI